MSSLVSAAVPEVRSSRFPPIGKRPTCWSW